MHKLIDYICDELMDLEERIEHEGGLSKADLQYADTLAHCKKNLLKCEEMDGSYRGRSYRGDGGSYEGGSYEGGSSYRGRRNARRDSMGRYSRDGGYSRSGEDMANQLRTMMQETSDDGMRRDMERLIERMEQQK